MNVPEQAHPRPSESPDITRVVVDGVPVFTRPVAARLSGALMFRVGRGDETLLQGGVSHMVEHLALHGFGLHQDYAFNGLVEHLRVVFHASGTPGELVTFFARVCDALRELPLERVPLEARVLRTEAAGRSQGLTGLLHRQRYGTRGPGASVWREFALDRPDPEVIRAWAARYFTSGNAAAWFSGPVPEGLRFPLPPGPRREGATPTPIPGLALPAWLEGPSGCVCVSMTGTRADWLFPPARIAALRIEQALRAGKGTIYSAQIGYDLTGPGHAHTLIAVTTLDSHAPAVKDEVLSVLRDLARAGPTEAELHGMAAEMERYADEPDAHMASLDQIAFNELLEYPTRTTRQLADDLRRMDPAEMARRLGAGLESALFMVPAGTHVADPGLRPYHVPSAAVPARARRYRSANARFPWSGDRSELAIGDEGVAILRPGGHHATLLYSELVVASEWPDGALELTDADGFCIHISPTAWWDGQGAIRRIRAAVPAGLYVEVAE